MTDFLDNDFASAGRPWLEPWDVADLAHIGPQGDGTGWGGIDPDEVEYGTPLAELAERYRFLGDFLEAAAVAGHTSAIHEGVVMSLRAHHAWCVAEARTALIEGVDGDALCALDADGWRALIVVLEDLVADVETRAAEIHRTPIDGDPRLCAAEQGRALACEARARRARQRAEMTREDVHQE
jgi:hypothetical protein